jgi:hypothetical protein
MPYKFEFSAEHNILLLQFEGRLTDTILSELYWLMKKYSTATDAAASIWDLSAVSQCEVSPEFIRALVDRGPAMPHPTRRPRFIVAPTLGLAISRMVEIASARNNPLLKIMLSRNEALAALGIQSPHFEPLE